MDDKISIDELWAMFPNGIPAEVIGIIFGGDPDRTIAQVREQIKRWLADNQKSAPNKIAPPA